MIAVKNYTLQVGDFRLQDVTMDIKDGEIFAILGQNREKPFFWNRWRVFMKNFPAVFCTMAGRYTAYLCRIAAWALSIRISDYFLT